MMLDRLSATSMPYLYTVRIKHPNIVTQFSRSIVITLRGSGLYNARLSWSNNSISWYCQDIVDFYVNQQQKSYRSSNPKDQNCMQQVGDWDRESCCLPG